LSAFHVIIFTCIATVRIGNKQKEEIIGIEIEENKVEGKVFQYADDTILKVCPVSPVLCVFGSVLFPFSRSSLVFSSFTCD